MSVRLTFVLICSTFLGIVWAQEKTTSKKDISIGLVLSGGGAKCMAQIGALRVIEEAGINIDYIGGTSMGAIIGAMYALGFSVDEIEQYMRNVDWDALLSNKIARNCFSYFDRKSESKYLLSFPIEDNKILLPRGLNYAQYILKELSFITQQAYKYEDFSQFPIPFFCVATNLENGQMEIFEDGKLMDALRASTAFPSLFTPYEVNGKLYVDGGVVNNYPIQPLKEKGVEFIIGVDVQDFLYKKKDINTILKVLEQISSFASAREFEKQKKYTDIFIKPKFLEADIISFDLFDIIVSRGEKAAREKLEELRQIAQGNPSRPMNSKLHDPMPLKSFYVKNIVVNGNENISEKYIISKLRIQKEGVCSINRLNRGIDLLYGTRYFENVNHTITPADTGYTLHINLKEKSFLSQFRLGLHYDDDFKTALLLNYTNRNFLFKKSRLVIDVVAGINPRLFANYFVDRGYIPTMGLELRSNRFGFKSYQNFDSINRRVYTDFSVDLFLQSTIYDSYALGAGIQLEHVDIHQNSSIFNVENLNKSYINYYGYIDFDSFDNADYPRKGFKFFGQWRIIAERRKFEEFFEPSSVIDVKYDQASSFTPWFFLNFQLMGAATLGSDLDDPYKIYLGSLGRNYINYILPFIGYRYMELIGRNALVARADLHFEIVNNHYLIVRGNFGKLEPTLNSLFNSDVLLDGYSLAYSYNSLIGPLELNFISSTNHSEVYVYLSLGFWF